MRITRRWSLWFFADYVSRLSCCPLAYCSPDRSQFIPIRSTLDVSNVSICYEHIQHVLLVEMAGVEPASPAPFGLLHTTIEIFIIQP